MRNDDLLNKASRLLRRKKYAEAIRTLEPNALLYRDSFKYRYILAVACLYSGDFGGAFTYLKSARDLKPHEVSVLLGFAVLYLRRGETDRAIDLYLEVQDVDEKNAVARNALKIIRKYSNTDSFVDWLDSGKLSRLYPPLPKVPFNPSALLIPMICVFALFALTFTLLIGFKKINPPFLMLFQLKSDRKGFPDSLLDQEERGAPMETGGVYRYILTHSQVLTMYEQARELFTKYNDERAKVLLNRILESNASEPVKTKSGLLLSYMDTPGFDTLKDRITYGEVMDDPILYRDCYVMWKGMATNLIVEQNSTAFDFLVGYDTRNVLEGVVNAVFGFSVSVNTEKPLEILGKIIPSEKGDRVSLEGVAIHQIGLLGR
jgi:tetratricopeptide (TPR) repeat protein